MANVQHSSLPESELHESKGVSTATADSFYVANGSGSGSWKKRLIKFQITISPTAVSANTTSEQTFTCTGLVLATDYIIGISKPTHQTGLGVVGWRVSADNTVAIAFMNNTGGSITPTASQVYTVIAWRD